MLIPQTDLGPEYSGFALNPDASGYVTAAAAGLAPPCTAPSSTATVTATASATATKPPPKPIESYSNQYEFEPALLDESGSFILIDAVDNFADEDEAEEALDDFMAAPADHMTMAGCPENEITQSDEFEPTNADDGHLGVEQLITQTDAEGTEREFTVTAVGFTRDTFLGKVLIAHYSAPERQASASQFATVLDSRMQTILAEDTQTPDGSRTPRASGETPGPSASLAAGETPGGPSATQGGGGGGGGASAPGINALGCSPASVQTGQSVTCSPVTVGPVTARSWSVSGGSPSSGSGSTFTTSFSSAGQKTIELRACNGSACSTAAQVITVSSPQTAPPGPGPGPTAPSIGGLGCSPGSVETGQTVTCNPSISGTVTSYSWSASGGSPGSGSGGSFSTSFGSSGSYTISLQACNSGACSSNSQGISVSAPQVQTYDVFIDSGTIGFGQTITLNLYASVPSNGLGYFDIDVVYDPAILAPVGCVGSYGGCDPAFDFDVVNFYGTANTSGELVLGSVTFQGIDFGYSDVFVFIFEIYDIAGNDVYDDSFEYHGSITVQ
jgi:hypothetical protein